MNCYFCQQEIGTLKTTATIGSLLCTNHSVGVTHKYGAMTYVLLRVVFRIMLGDREFEVILCPFEERTEINLLKRFRYGEMPRNIKFSGRMYGNGKQFTVPTLIKRFDFLIPISPETAPIKIPTIITFS